MARILSEVLVFRQQTRMIGDTFHMAMIFLACWWKFLGVIAIEMKCIAHNSSKQVVSAVVVGSYLDRVVGIQCGFYRLNLK